MHLRARAGDRCKSDFPLRQEVIAIYVVCEYIDIRCCDGADGAGALNCSVVMLPNFRDTRCIAPSGTEQVALQLVQPVSEETINGSPCETSPPPASNGSKKSPSVMGSARMP
jgi:hypothetical protein